MLAGRIPERCLDSRFRRGSGILPAGCTGLSRARPAPTRPSQPRPVESGAGVGFASWGDVLVACNGVSGEPWIVGDQSVEQRAQAVVLGVLEGDVVGAFQFDAEGEVCLLYTSPSPRD